MRRRWNRAVQRSARTIATRTGWHRSYRAAAVFIRWPPRGATTRALITVGLADRELATVAGGLARLTDRGCFAIGHLWGPRR